MFVRTKRIQNKEYAYLVANEWTTSGSRQKVVKYLGKIHKPEKKIERTIAFDSMKELDKLFTDAIKWELENHGFQHNNGILTKEGIIVNLNEGSVTAKNRNTVLGLNDGFLCEHTLQELKHFAPSTNQEETSMRLATKTIEAGLKLPTEAVVQLFEKMFKQE